MLEGPGHGPRRHHGTGGHGRRGRHGGRQALLLLEFRSNALSQPCQGEGARREPRYFWNTVCLHGTPAHACAPCSASTVHVRPGTHRCPWMDDGALRPQHVHFPRLPHK